MKNIKNPVIRYLLILSTIGVLGSSLYRNVLIQFAATLEFAKWAIVVVSTTQCIPYLIQTIPGKYADKTKQKFSAMFYTQLFAGFIFIVIGLLLDLRNWFALVVILLLDGIVTLISLYESGLIAVIQKRYVPKKLLESSTGLITGITILIQMSGQSIGVGILVITHNDFQITAYINALTFFISAIFIYLKRHQFNNESLASIRQPSVSRETNHHKFTKSEFWNYVKNIFQANPYIMLTSLLFENFVFSGLFPYVSIILLHDKYMHVPYSVSILLFSFSMSLGFLIGSILADKILTKTPLPIIGMTVDILTIIFFFMMFIFHQPYVAFGFIFFIYLLFGKFDTKVYSRTIMVVDENILASFRSKMNSLVYLSLPLGTFVLPFIATVMGNFYSFILVAFCMAINIIILLFATWEAAHPKGE
ncbi:MFS transporter [Fructilactobacillus sp. Tb1]|uniref:MFS transporter n=1 Tax=Fructilactobacillus sp. Tb1 TaxID=3422304 RepID=UPI003D29DBC6